MENSGLKADAKIYNSAIRAFSRAPGRAAKKTTSRKSDDATDTEAASVDVFLHTPGGDEGGSGALWQKALGVLDQMEQEGVDKDGVTYIELVRMYSNYGEWRHATETLEEFENLAEANKLRVLPHGMTQAYNAAIHACFKGGGNMNTNTEL